MPFKSESNQVSSILMERLDHVSSHMWMRLECDFKSSLKSQVSNTGVSVCLCNSERGGEREGEKEEKGRVGRQRKRQ